MDYATLKAELKALFEAKHPVEQLKLEAQVVGEKAKAERLANTICLALEAWPKKQKPIIEGAALAICLGRHLARIDDPVTRELHRILMQEIMLEAEKNADEYYAKAERKERP